MDHEQLERAIAVIEAHRAVLSDGVVDLLRTLAQDKVALLAAQQVAVVAQQRKQVTVLFADVSGFTAMAELMDAEDVAEFMNALWQRLDIAILSHGGTIDKHIGDAIMALWGVQTAREDDPERAVQAAFAIQASLAAFNEEALARQVSYPHAARIFRALQLRIGLTTGPALLGTIGTIGEFTAMGDTINVAARIEQAAPVGAILVDHTTYRHVQDRFEIQPLEPLIVKGKHEPLSVYRVLRARPHTLHMFTRGTGGIQTPLVGRDDELKQLQRAFQQIVQRREAQLVVVVGEAGMGKSRLLYEFNQWLSHQTELGYILRGQASQSNQQVPYALLRDLLGSWLRLREHDDAATMRTSLEQAAISLLGPAAVEDAHFIGHLIGLDVADSPFLTGIREDTRQIRNRAVRAIARLLMAVRDVASHPSPAERRVVLLLDDLHWADTSSLEVLGEVLRICRQAPLLVVCGARLDAFMQTPGWQYALPPETTLRLGQLSDDDVAQLAFGLLRQPPDLPIALRNMIITTAEGNPFYVEELLKMFIEDGLIRSNENGSLVVLDQLPQIRVPTTLTGVLQARIDSLTPQERELLQCAAVIGRVFWDSAIATLMTDAPEMTADIAACFAALQHKEMIFPRFPTAFAGTCEYIFKHALLRDVAYERVLRRHRRTYHARAADWLAGRTQPQEQADVYTVLIAEHYDQAEMHGQASAWYARAGGRAAAQFANVEAVAHFSRALTLAPEGDRAGRYALVLAREQVYDVQGVRSAQLRDLHELAALAAALGDDTRRVEVALREANFAEITGDSLAAAAAAQRALALAHAASIPDGEAAAVLAWGRALWRQAAYAAAHTQFVQSLALARTARLPRIEAESLHHLGIVALEQGEHSAAWAYFENALRLFQIIGDRRGESAVLNKQGMVAADQGDYAAARSVWEPALRLLREIGDRRAEGAALQNLGLAAASQGDYGAARTAFEQALDCYRETSDRYGESSVLGDLGNIARAQGDYPHAREYLTQALHLHHEIGDRERTGWALAYLSLLCHTTGEDTAALDYSHQALRIAQDLGARRLQARALMLSGHTLGRVGDLDEATSAYQQALAIQQDLGAHNLAMEPLAGLAQIALYRGDLGQAQTQAEEILSYLALITLDGAEEPLRVYLTCYQIMHAVHDQRADGLLQKAHNMLHDQARRTGDPRLQRSFLTDVPIHHAIEDAWVARYNSGGQ